MSFKLSLGVNHCSNSEYHGDTSYLSSSQLKLILEDPAKFYNEVIMKNRKAQTGSHLELGSYVHALLLEPENIDKDFCFFTGWRKHGHAWDAFQADPKNAGKTAISLPQAELGKVLAASVKARPEALALLANGLPELSICTVLNGVPVKKRSDYIVPGKYIVDVKTTGHPAGADNFKEAILQYSYDLSAALYKEIADAHYGDSHDFYWLVISKTDKQCDLYKASEKTLEKGKKLVYSALETYKVCQATGLWKKPEVVQIEQPDYKIIEI